MLMSAGTAPGDRLDLGSELVSRADQPDNHGLAVQVHSPASSQSIEKRSRCAGHGPKDSRRVGPTRNGPTLRCQAVLSDPPSTPLSPGQGRVEQQSEQRSVVDLLQENVHRDHRVLVGRGQDHPGG